MRWSCGSRALIEQLLGRLPAKYWGGGLEPVGDLCDCKMRVHGQPTTVACTHVERMSLHWLQPGLHEHQSSGSQPLCSCHQWRTWSMHWAGAWEALTG